MFHTATNIARQWHICKPYFEQVLRKFQDKKNGLHQRPISLRGANFMLTTNLLQGILETASRIKRFLRSDRGNKMIQSITLHEDIPFYD